MGLHEITRLCPQCSNLFVSLVSLRTPSVFCRFAGSPKAWLGHGMLTKSILNELFLFWVLFHEN